MTTARFLLGIPVVLLALGPLVVGAGAIRRRLVPDRGLDGAIVDLVLVVTAVVVVAELLGSFGWFRLAPFTIACAALGVGASMLDRRNGLGEESAAQVGPAERWDVEWWMAAGAVVVVVGSWMSRIVTSLREGMSTPDTMWYHLPASVRFVQTGRLTGTPLQDGDSVTAFYPLTGSLLHAFGFLFFGSDLLSILLNLGWLAVLVACAARIGTRYDVGPAAVLAAVVVVATPVLVGTQPGGALTDVAGIALMLCALTIALAAEPGRLTVGRAVPIGLALGLSTGMKFTFLFPAGAIALSVAVLAPRGRRIAVVAIASGAAAITGAYWFIRNAYATHNPLPSLDLSLGPLHLTGIEPAFPPLQTPRELLTQNHVWSSFLFPGFRDAYGPVWTVILVLAAAGIIGGLIRRNDRRLQVLAVVTAATVVVFVYTPQYLLGGAFWATTVRYLLPAVLLGLILFPIVIPRGRTLITAALAILVIATQLDATVWTVGFGGKSFFGVVPPRDAIAGAALTVTAAIGGWALVRFLPIRPFMRRPIAMPFGVVVVLLVLAVVQRPYAHRRYAATVPFPRTFAWAQRVHGDRIALNGPLLSLKYPLAGSDLSNRLQYLAFRGTDGRVRDPATCEEWRGLLRSDRFDYVIVSEIGDQPGPVSWTASIRGARAVLTETPPITVNSTFTAFEPPTLTVFALPHRQQLGTC